MGCVDDENNVDVSVYQGDVEKKSCGTLQLTYGLKQSDQIYTLICNAEGDTVKLSKDTGHIAVSEVVVISTGIEINPISLNFRSLERCNRKIQIQICWLRVATCDPSTNFIFILDLSKYHKSE